MKKAAARGLGSNPRSARVHEAMLATGLCRVCCQNTVRNDNKHVPDTARRTMAHRWRRSSPELARLRQRRVFRYLWKEVVVVDLKLYTYVSEMLPLAGNSSPECLLWRTPVVEVGYVRICKEKENARHEKCAQGRVEEHGGDGRAGDSRGSPGVDENDDGSVEFR